MRRVMRCSGQSTRFAFFKVMVFTKLRDCQSYLEYWNTAILEYWLKPHNFCIWVKAFGINFYDFSMDVFIGTKDYGTGIRIVFSIAWQIGRHSESWGSTYRGCVE